MKLAITSMGGNLESEVDSRFGRAHNFIIYDTETDTWELLNNGQGLNATHGAGIQTAQAVVDAGVQAVITGNTGPKAFSVLKAANVDIYINATGTVKDMIERFKAGELTKVDSANVDGHW